jgi:Calcium-activated chloride channel
MHCTANSITLSTLLLPLLHPLCNVGVSANSTIASNPSSVSASQPQSSTWGSRISASDLRDPSFWTVTLFYPCMYSILVDVSIKLFALLALRLTNFENHRTQTTFVNRLVLKVSDREWRNVCANVCMCEGVRGRGRKSKKEGIQMHSLYFLSLNPPLTLTMSPLLAHFDFDFTLVFSLSH